MNQTLHEAKASLREKVRQAILAMPPDVRAGMDHHICTHLLTSCEFRCSSGILLYCACFPEEIRTRPLLQACLSTNKRLYLPRALPEGHRLKVSLIDDPDSQLEEGYCHIPEPRADLPEADLAGVDLIIVPGLAFDELGFRLGRGGGYYDRLLSTVHTPVFTVGLAYEVQMVPDVPRGEGDRPVGAVMTEDRIIHVGASPCAPQ